MGQGGRGGHGEARGRGVRGSAFGGDVAGEVAVPFRPRIVHPYSRNHPPTAQAVATWLLVARARWAPARPIQSRVRVDRPSPCASGLVRACVPLRGTWAVSASACRRAGTEGSVSLGA